MKKRIYWMVLEGNGKPLYEDWEGFSKRSWARDEVKDRNARIFEDWNKDTVFPLSIERREWALVDVKKVQ